VGDDILFLRPRLMGDIIFTIPAISLFARHFPHVRIHYVVEPAFEELARLIPSVHKVITVRRDAGFPELKRFRQGIRGIGFRVAVDFHSGPRSALLTRITGIPFRIGYRTANRNWAYTAFSPRHLPRSPVHSVNNQVRLLEHFDIPHRPVPFYPEIPLPPDSALPETEPDPLRVVIHVGAGNRFREWGESHFRQLCELLLEAGLSVSLIGHSEAERATASRLERDLDVRNLTGRLPVSSTLRLISGSGVYVGVDSGPLHLASLTRTPLVALFGPNLPAVSGPWRNRDVTILQTRLDCRPCSQHRCRYDTIRCMQEIDAHDVFKAVLRHIR